MIFFSKATVARRVLCYSALIVGSALTTFSCGHVEEAAPADQHSTATTEQMAIQAAAELADIKQPNGKPVNIHLVNMINSTIDIANHYRIRINKLSKAEQQEDQKEIIKLKSQPESSANNERIAILMGFKNLSEFEKLSRYHDSEKLLLQQEDPEYFKLSTQDQTTTTERILSHHRRNGDHYFVQPNGIQKSS